MYHNGFFFLLLLLLHIVNSFRFVFEETTAPVIISELLQQFHDYKVTIHFDNVTKDYLNIIMISNNAKATPKYMLNYDYNEPFEFQRSSGEKYMNLVYLKEPEKFIKFTRIERNLLSADFVIFLMENYREIMDKSVWNINGVENVGGFMIFELDTHRFHYTKFFSGNNTKVIHTIKTNGISRPPNLLNYLNPYNDFNWHNFTIGYTEFRPYLWCKNLINNQCEFDGAEGNFLKELSTRLKFRYHSVLFNDHVSAWNAMVQAVHNKEVDWAMGVISYTIKRRTKVDFTSPLSSSLYDAVYKAEKPKTPRANLLKPFSNLVWITLLITYTLIVLNFVIIRNVILSKAKHSYLLIVVATSLEQPLPMLNRPPSSFNVLFGFFLFVGMLMGTHYKCDIMAKVISPKIWYPNTWQELFHVGYQFAVMGRNSSTVDEAIMESKNPLLENMRQQFIYGLTECVAVKRTLTTRTAYIGEFLPLKTQLLNNCDGVLSREDLKLLRITGSKMFPNFHAWPVQYGKPMMVAFSRAITKMQSAGLFVHWYSINGQKGGLDVVLDANAVVKKDFEPLGLSRIINVFLVLFVGLLVAGVVFIFENIIWKCNK